MWNRMRAWMGRSTPRRRGSLSGGRPWETAGGAEALEVRRVLSASPLPVLMVIADQSDFYYQEYGDTRASLEQAGLSVQVAARTTLPSTPHAGSGQGSGSGVVVPDLALSDVDADQYSAIVFVGGWGSSMYQYAFEGTYSNSAYNGDLATKEVVNDLINDFVDQDKHVTAICHGVTVLAWARVDGVSPLSGKQVSVPFIGSPAVDYAGQSFGNFQLMQAPQVQANGGTTNTVSGQFGDPNTVADDVVVDGRVITAENYDAAAEFGRVIAREVLARFTATVTPPPAPVNHPPVFANAAFSLAENAAVGTLVGSSTATDPDPGQTVSYSITAGNAAGAFVIDAASGEIRVANAALLDFETTSVFQLEVTATDSGTPALSATALVTISLQDVLELPATPVGSMGSDLVVQGTAGDDTIYVWSSGGRAFVWMNGVQSPSQALGPGGRVVVYSGAGNDRVFATDSLLPVTVFAGAGHDLVTGGAADDILDGGEGVDRLSGMGGNDILLGGAGNDFLDGNDGDDVVVGGDGNDQVKGSAGHDVLIGGLGTDFIDGGTGDDLLIGGTTTYDTNVAALGAISADWRTGDLLALRLARLDSGLPSGVRLQKGATVFDDLSADRLQGNFGTDAVFAGVADDPGYIAGWDRLV